MLTVTTAASIFIELLVGCSASLFNTQHHTGSIICDILMNKHFETDETLFFNLVHKLETMLDLFRTLPSFLLDGCGALRHVPLFNVRA